MNVTIVNGERVDGGPPPDGGGAQGPPGEQGTPGSPGEIGPAGPQGDPGPQGVPGADGQPGAEGPQGPTGPQGDQGTAGAKGDPGDVGPEGSQGLQGEVGPAGAKGDAGAQGIKGDTGSQGPQGDVGPQGPPTGPHTHAEGEVTNLTADLAAKAPTGHNHAAAYEPIGATATHAGAVDPHTGYQKESEKDQNSGYAGLDGSGLVPDARVASTIARDSEVTAAVAAEALLARNADNLTSGTVADARIAATIARDAEVAAAYSPLAHTHVPGDATTLDGIDSTAFVQTTRTVNAKPLSSNITIDKTDVGLGSADNVADAAKPVSTATQTALNAKAPLSYAALANGTLAMAFATNNTVKVTPTATGTFTTTVPPAGTRCTLIVLTAGASSFTITFGSGFKATGTLATGTTAARVFVVSFVSDGANLYEASRTAAMVA